MASTGSGIQGQAGRVTGSNAGIGLVLARALTVVGTAVAVGSCSGPDDPVAIAGPTH
jgi:hypothetical protein